MHMAQIWLTCIGNPKNKDQSFFCSNYHQLSFLIAENLSNRSNVTIKVVQEKPHLGLATGTGGSSVTVSKHCTYLIKDKVLVFFVSYFSFLPPYYRNNHFVFKKIENDQSEELACITSLGYPCSELLYKQLNFISISTNITSICCVYKEKMVKTTCYATTRYICKKNLVVFCVGLS